MESKKLAVINLTTIVEQLNIDCHFLGASPLGNGLINDTYLVDVGNDEGFTREIVIQRINHNVFKDVPSLMSNILNVTKALKAKIIDEHGDAQRETLTVIPTKEGSSYVLENGQYYRAYIYIGDSFYLDEVKSHRLFYESAIVSANFQRRLLDFPADTLVESIPNFHNTVSRYSDFEKAVNEDKVGRLKNITSEVEFCVLHKYLSSFIVDKLASGELPLRVTHNDTKLNNILFDKKTEKGLCLVDLDTIMPGSMLYDVGDAIRTGCVKKSSHGKKYRFDKKLYKVYYKGFTSVLDGLMTQSEKEYFHMGGIIMTYELLLRFLTDYLQGDTYFKTKYPEENLDRALRQKDLLQDMLKQFKIE